MVHQNFRFCFLHLVPAIFFRIFPRSRTVFHTQRIFCAAGYFHPTAPGNHRRCCPPRTPGTFWRRSFQFLLWTPPKISARILVKGGRLSRSSRSLRRWAGNSLVPMPPPPPVNARDAVAGIPPDLSYRISHGVQVGPQHFGDLPGGQVRPSALRPAVQAPCMTFQITVPSR